MRCDACGCQATTKYVEFYQNIGMLVMRQSRSIKGELCKKCINEYFTKFTLTTAAVGWFGMISMIVTPFFILNNVIRFCGTIGMRKPREAAPLPSDHPTLSLTPDVIRQLEPFRQEIILRMNSGESIDAIAMNVAPRAKASAYQVELFVEQIAR